MFSRLQLPRDKSTGELKYRMSHFRWLLPVRYDNANYRFRHIDAPIPVFIPQTRISVYVSHNMKVEIGHTASMDTRAPNIYWNPWIRNYIGMRIESRARAGAAARVIFSNQLRSAETFWSQTILSCLFSVCVCAAAPKLPLRCLSAAFRSSKIQSERRTVISVVTYAALSLYRVRIVSVSLNAAIFLSCFFFLSFFYSQQIRETVRARAHGPHVYVWMCVCMWAASVWYFAAKIAPWAAAIDSPLRPGSRSNVPFSWRNLLLLPDGVYAGDTMAYRDNEGRSKVAT